MKYIFLSIFAIVLFTSCSSKQFFEPIDTTSIEKEIIDIPSYIKEKNTQGATLKDNRYIDNFGISSKKLKDGFYFVNNNNSDIISANKQGEVYINNTSYFKFKSAVIAASIKGDIMALIFANNSIALYDIKEKEFKFKQYQKVSYLNDIRISMPLFLNSLVLFPTLDGNVVVVNTLTFVVSKTLNIDPDTQTNNIILLKNIGDNLLIASSNIILSLSKGQAYKKNFFIQSYTYDKNYIYIATLDGRILKLTSTLDLIASKKFKFAKFQTLAVKDETVYAIESQGFIVKINKDFTKVEVDEISFENDEKTFSSKNKIYFENKLIKF